LAAGSFDSGSFNVVIWHPDRSPSLRMTELFGC
jgi:hypothetical protein